MESVRTKTDGFPEICCFFGAESLLWGQKSCSHPKAFGTRAELLRGATQIRDVMVPFGLLVRGGCRGRFRPRSAAVLRPGRTGHFQRCVPLCGSISRVLLRHRRGFISFDCMRWGEKSQAMGRVEGFTMQRQSKSPRASPRTSISAVAILLAKGMLFWSHRREI